MNNEVLSNLGQNLKIAGTKNLAPRFVGPSKVLQRTNKVAYKLELPPTMHIHDVFTSLCKLQLLKQHHSADGKAPPPPPAEVIDSELE